MKNRGFTLVELLVVIAIIGILSTVAVVNLNSARTKAKKNALLATMTSIYSAAILCFDSGENLTCGSSNWTEEGSMCDGQSWPTLPEGTKPLACVSDVNINLFMYVAGEDANPSTFYVSCERVTGRCSAFGF